ncbi:glycosyltransferase family 4 protein [Desulfonatronum thiodismutans]|uniref:glycosyltransferase family 4 protein n=1 Tax=Desulfonatronum thiodismutans TaxID=159290 RepID=UPI0004ABE3B3|nr:glycosyltransferase family 4 protein [Desulfonatronum thiodismutans]
MKILHIAPTPFFSDRGCHIRIHDQIAALQRQGHDVLLTTYHHGRDVPGIPTRRSLRVPWYSKVDAGFSWHKLYLDVLLFFTVWRACLNFKPDIIHGHLHEGAALGWATSLLASARKIPVVFDVQGSLSGEIKAYGSLGPLKKLLFLFTFLEKLVCKLPDFFVCSSEAAAHLMKAEFGVPEDKIRVIREGVDESSCSVDDASCLRESLGIPQEKMVVGYIGSLVRAKGIDLLIQAMPAIRQRVENVHFLLAGYPLEECQGRVDAIGTADVTTLCGKVDYFQLFSHLSVIDVAVDPKQEGSGEGSGKILNYMSAGLPVVCFDTPANRALLGADGRYAAPGDAMDLAEKIVALLLDSDQARIIGGNNQSCVFTKYSATTQARALEDIYRRLVTN